MTNYETADLSSQTASTPPLVSAIYTTGIQLTVFALAIFLSLSIESPSLLLFIQSLTALLLTGLFKLSLPWQACNLLLPPAIFFSSHNTLPTYGLIGLIAILFLIYLPTFWTRVPYYPASKKVIAELSHVLTSKSEAFSFIDLGSGFGELLFQLAKNFPNGHFIGVELSPLAYLSSKIRASRYQNVEIRYQNFWKISLSEYDYIYAFLAPPPMEAIWRKLKQEAKADCIVLINSFPLPIKHSKRVPINNLRNSDLYIYNQGDL